jgi:SAM-dependent MidA family methyltransferase
VSELEEIIRREIAHAGPMPFARFMELALYCPKLGYYERAPHQIGRRGDYFTSVSTGSVFGELLAFQAADWFPSLLEDRWQWVEAGAHDGRLAADMLAWLRRHHPELMERLEYWIIEPSAERRVWQRNQLEEFAGLVRWWDSLDSLPHPVTGVVFSNELLDAMPVLRLGWDSAARRWFEWRVIVEAEQFAWVRCEIDPTQAGMHLGDGGIELSRELLAVLPDGFTLDLSLAAGRWWQTAAKRLRAGRLLTIDYGLTATQFFAPERNSGTVRAYAHHLPVADLLTNVGEQDLTAHVNFTQLERAGASVGLRTEGLCSQAHFLTDIAQRTWEPNSGVGKWTRAQVRQFQTLIHPEHLGRAFQVLVQAR